MIRFFMLVVAILLFSYCSSSMKKKRTYDKEGHLYEEYDYQNSKDTSNYQLTRYYKNGNTEFSLPFKANKIEGVGKVFYPDGSIEFIRTYKNSNYNGVTYYFHKQNGGLFKEFLYLDNEVLVSAEYGMAIDKGDTLRGVTYYYPAYSNDTIYKLAGSLTYFAKKVDPRLNSYFKVIADDTIHNGSKYCINIELLLGKNKDLDFSLTVGKFNNKLEFIDSTRTQTIMSDQNVLTFNIKNYHMGTNLILGKIKVYRKGEEVTSYYLDHPQIKEYIFYKQFEVID